MKIYFCILTAFFLHLNTYAQERKTPLVGNVLLQGNQFKDNESTNNATLPKTILRKTNVLTLPFQEYFSNINSTTPDALKWLDDFVAVNSQTAIFDNKDDNGITYQKGFAEADVLTTRLINTLGAGTGSYIHFTYSTGTNWRKDDSLILQVKGSDDVWKIIWRAPNIVNTNRDVFLNFSFINEFANNNIQFKFTNFCQTDTSIAENYRLTKFIISYKNTLPLYQSFRTFTPITLSPLPQNWTGFTNEVSNNDSAIMLWGNSVLFNSITNKKDSSYFNNSGGYGNADTLMLNPIDLSKSIISDQLVLSFWVRSFKNTRTNDSLYLEIYENTGRWQRYWATDTTFKSDYQKVNITLTGRSRHPFFSFRFINKGTYSKTDTNNFAIAALKITAKRSLPLVEDFSSTTGYYPDEEKWIDKKVFINNNFPKNQPSINVATFDGLDENGNAYSKFPIKSVTDVLTSKGFNLSNFGLKDSIYFSFFYQYQLQGTTQQIQPTDSLYLEFRSSPNDADSFVTIWKKSALDTLGYDTFNRVLLQIPSEYLHDDFQFRFKTIGSLTGNVSQWHIDYIKLDNGRSRFDTSNVDVAISASPTSMLRKYRSMPWSHFELNKAKYTNDSVYFSVFNNDNRNYSVDFRKQLIDNENSVVSTINDVEGFVPFLSHFPLAIANPNILNTSSTKLVKQFNNKVAVSANNFSNNDNIPTNDSITVTTRFSNYFAYDDGSAEGGYGIYLKTNASVALAYDLEKPDTIYGVEVFFNQSQQDVSTRNFDLMVWSGITPVNQQADNDKVQYRKNGVKPIYTNSINGFATILFDSAIVVGNRFFIGWEQLGQFILNIGLDENYYEGNKLKTNPNMFYKTDGTWKATEIPGALMLRPLLGQVRDFPASINKTLVSRTDFNFNLYPNPTSSAFTIESNYSKNLTVYLFDLFGKEMMNEKMQNNVQQFHLPSLSKGIYIIQVIDANTGSKLSKKLIIE